MKMTIIVLCGSGAVLAGRPARRHCGGRGGAAEHGADRRRPRSGHRRPAGRRYGSAIPASMLAIYRRPPGLSRPVLDDPGGHRHHRIRQRSVVAARRPLRAQPAGAEGPMQFEPATFEQYDLPGAAGRASPAVSVRSGRRGLRGGPDAVRRRGGRRARSAPAAIYAYNHSTAYVDAVLQLADRLDQEADTAGAGAGPPGRPPRAGGRPVVSSPCRPDRHPLPVGRRDARRGLRLLGLGAGGLGGRRRATCPAWPRSSSTPGRCCLRAPRSQPGDLVFFGPAERRRHPRRDGGRPRRARWWTPRTRVHSCGSKPFPADSRRQRGAVTSTWAPPGLVASEVEACTQAWRLARIDRRGGRIGPDEQPDLGARCCDCQASIAVASKPPGLVMV